MRKVGNFFYALMLTVLVALATFMLLLLILGVVDSDAFECFVMNMFPPEVVLGFFAVVVLIGVAYLVYNTVRFVANAVKKNKKVVVECIVTGISMTAGVCVLIYLLIISCEFGENLKPLAEVVW